MYGQIEKQVDLHDATAHIFRHSYLPLLDAARGSQDAAGHRRAGGYPNHHEPDVHEREKDIEAAGVKLNNMMNVSLKPRSEEEKGRETSAA